MRRALIIFFAVLAVCALFPPIVFAHSLGIIALLAWAGLYVGPALALLASIMPTYRSVLPTTAA
jgi:hypothetical protein